MIKQQEPTKTNRSRSLSLNSCKLLLDSGEHCHDDEQQHKTDKVARRKLWIASILCVIFMIGEAVGKFIKTFFCIIC